MVLSIEELKALASNLMKEGLNTQQIADELSLSQDTITWLLSGTGDSERPSDVRIGWRTLGVRPQRIAAVGSIMADVADESSVSRTSTPLSAFPSTALLLPTRWLASLNRT